MKTKVQLIAPNMPWWRMRPICPENQEIRNWMTLAAQQLDELYNELKEHDSDNEEHF